MLEQTRRGLAVAGASARVLAQHPRLLVLPLLGSAASLATLVLLGGSMSLGQTAHAGPLFFVLGYVGLFAAVGFIGAFFNAALVLCVLDGFAGREVSLRHGLAGAAQRAPQLFSWVLFSAIVGFFISMVEGVLRRLGILGAIFGSALNMGWSIATYFVVPILVVERVGPFDAFERSKELVKRNWGKAIGVQTGLIVLFMLALVPVFVLIGFVNADSTAHAQKLLLSGGIAAIYFVALAALFATLGGVFRASLYIYATTGQVPPRVDPALFESTLRKG